METKTSRAAADAEAVPTHVDDDVTARVEIHRFFLVDDAGDDVTKRVQLPHPEPTRLQSAFWGLGR